MYEKFQKLIAIVLIVGTLLMPIRVAQAQFVVHDPISFVQFVATKIGQYTLNATAFLTNLSVGSLALKENVLDNLAFLAKKVILAQINRSLVTWINSGFEGNPSFIADFGNFIEDTADQISGALISQMANPNAICGPFSLDIRLQILKNERARKSASIGRYSCTLNSISGNARAFLDNFNQGGWARWLSSFDVQNHPYSSLVLNEEQIFRVQAAEEYKKTQELFLYNGFKPPKDQQGNNTTPPGTQKAVVDGLLADEKTEIHLADEFTEVIDALVGQLLTRVVQGARGIFGATRRDNTGANFIEQVQTQANVQYATQQGEDRDAFIRSIDQAIAVITRYRISEQDALNELLDTKETLLGLKRCLETPVAERSGALQFETVDTRFVVATTTVVTTVNMTPGDATDLATTNSKLNTEINPAILNVQNSIAIASSQIDQLRNLSFTAQNASASAFGGYRDQFNSLQLTFINEADAGRADAEYEVLASSLATTRTETRQRTSLCYNPNYVAPVVSQTLPI